MAASHSIQTTGGPLTPLSVRGVYKSFGTSTALAAIDLTVPAGSRTAIVGPSGSGKTTLLRVIAGFDTPDAGSARLGEQLLFDGPRGVPAYKRQIGFVPQDGALFPHLNISENIAFGLPRRDPGNAARVAELMDMVDLSNTLLTRWPHELSGGQQQRVALARALTRSPRLMLLDEPFSALDTGLRSTTRRAVMAMLGQAGITTILVTHDQGEALAFADQVVVMRRGRLVQAATPLDLYMHPNDVDTAHFLGEANVLPAQIASGCAHCALGSVAVDAPNFTGPAQIMLRPEQLALETAPITNGASVEAASSLALVTEIDFRGPTSMLTLRLKNDTSPYRDLLARCFGLMTPRPGTTVRISVTGQAHVLPGDPLPLDTQPEGLVDHNSP